MRISSSPPARLATIQALRALAAMAVVLSHIAIKETQFAGTALLPGVVAGSFGVHLFFVISGIIMAHVAPPQEFSWNRMSDFVLRRVIRILPLYWLITFAALAIFYLRPDFVSSLGRELIRPVASIFLWPTDGRYVVLVGWTLTYEMFFYGLFALTMTFGRRQTIVLPAIIIALVGLPLLLSADNFGPIWEVVTSYRLLEFAAGYLFCILCRFHIGRHAPLGLAAAATGLALFLLGSLSSPAHPALLAIPAILITCGLLLAETSIPIPPFLTRLGDESYSLYLIHGFVLLVVARAVYAALPAGPLASSVFLVAGTLASVAAASGVYRLIERPMSKILGRFWERHAPSALRRALSKHHRRPLSCQANPR